MTQTPAFAQKSRVCKKLIVDSVPVAGCARIAPTVIAVHRWGVCGAQQSMVFITRTTISTIDSIYAYTLHKIFQNFKITLFAPLCIDSKSTLIRSFCYRKSIYLDMWLGQNPSRIFY
jgi:hypothetical protein